MAPPILTLKNIHLSFGSTPLLEGAEFTVEPGARMCLVGRNGSGKSTLLKIAAGLIQSDEGERFLKPGTTVRYMHQEPDLSSYANLADYISGGLEGADDGYRIHYLMDALGLDGDADPKNISGGEARRAALARALAPEPDLLMLDEPTNHLDLPIIEWLEGELSSYKGALILISHDRRFLSKLTRETIWVDRGETRQINKGFGSFEDWRDNFLEQEQLDRHKLSRKIEREQHWVVHGVSGRRKRNVRRLKELGNLRDTKRNEKQSIGKANISVTEGQTSGKLVAKLEQVSKAFGDRIIIDNFSTRIARGDRIGIIGPNGSGKTTLLKLIMGQLDADDGTIKLGTNLQPLVLDQKREGLEPETTLKDALTGGGGDSVIVGDIQKHVIGYMKDFLFLPEQQRTPISRLSGGERARLELARGLRLPSNLLILDEPTNDLDLETLDLLQELIADYKGTVLLVSHDRDFLDRTVNSVIAFEGDAHWQEYAGGYSDMIAQRGYGVKAAEKDRQKTSSSGSKSNSNTDSNTGKPKLSYKHKFALETLPKTIAALEAELAKLNTKLEDPEYYIKDPDGFTQTIENLDIAQTKLEKCEEEWLELELLRETAEQ
ncbi:MAG: elongation factor 3 [Robiginitomaculum sp.]|nr:MAG: elongation factor 3 [Robiginitomaculum sp.]